MMGLPYGEEIVIVGRTVWTQSTSVTDGRTDRRTDRITITKTVQRRASHDKKNIASPSSPCRSCADYVFEISQKVQCRRLEKILRSDSWAQIHVLLTSSVPVCC